MNPLTPNALLDAAIAFSAEAARIPLRHFRSGVSVDVKADASPVTVADRDTELNLRAAIASRFPDHGILGEEFGTQDGERRYLWVIDPIDGTKSFISGSPLFGMLIGVLEEGIPQAGLIRMPALDECFAGAIGEPATLNGRAIRCSEATSLADARIYLNEADIMMREEPERFGRLMNSGTFRRLAFDCYSFGLLALGEVDAVIDFDLKPHDYLPVVPVVEAAGGIITDWRGGPLRLNSDGSVVAAATPELHAEIVRLIA